MTHVRDNGNTDDQEERAGPLSACCLHTVVNARLSCCGFQPVVAWNSSVSALSANSTPVERPLSNFCDTCETSKRPSVHEVQKVAPCWRPKEQQISQTICSQGIHRLPPSQRAPATILAWDKRKEPPGKLKLARSHADSTTTRLEGQISTKLCSMALPSDKGNKAAHQAARIASSASGIKRQKQLRC